MLTQSDLLYDTRVLREADALGRAGFDVHVVHRTRGEKRTWCSETGVVYHAVPLVIPLPARRMLRMLQVHAGVLSRAASRISGGRALSSGFELLGVPLLGLALLGSAVAHGISRAIGTDPRVRGSGVRGRIGRIAHWLVQPIVYLNEHAANCLTEVSSLKPDVIHAHDLVTLSAGAVAARRTGAALVYDAHEIETETNNWSLNRMTAHYVARYEATLIRGVAATVTVTDGIADWLADKYGIERPVVVMNTPTADASSTPQRLRQTLDLDPSVPLVVYVGGVMANRGLEECVRALPLLPGVHFALVGPRFPDTEEVVLAEAARAGVSARVHLVDPVPPADVTAFISDADCGVIPIQNVCLSYFYCFPNKLLETIVAGLPVAVANLLELSRFVDETGLGIVMDERDPASIAAALTEILGNPDRYAVTPAILTDVLSRYGWPVQEGRLLELYERLAPRPSASLNEDSDRSRPTVQAGT